MHILMALYIRGEKSNRTKNKFPFTSLENDMLISLHKNFLTHLFMKNLINAITYNVTIHSHSAN